MKDHVEIIRINYRRVFMKKVLVTGADGFIGRHLVNKLLSENIETFAITYPGNGDQL